MAKQFKRLLNLTLDVVFKTFFKRNEPLLKDLLTAFLPLPKGWVIDKIYIMDTELNPDRMDKKTFILDFKLKVKLIKRYGNKLRERMVNVEMQTVAHKYIADRFLAYTSRLFSEQLPAGESYEEIRPVYSLVFTLANWKEFKETDEYYHVCTLQRTTKPHLSMSEGMVFVVVELGKFKKKLKDLIDFREIWCYLLKYSSQMGPEECQQLEAQGGDMAKEIVDQLWILSKNETLRELAMIEDRQKRDLKAVKETMYEEGIEKGIEKGRKEERRDVALNLLNKGVDPKLISDSTGLSEKELEILKNNVK